MLRTQEQLDQGALHVAFAIDMACSLVPLTDDSSLPTAASIACLESYHSHMRTLVEFLLHDRQKRDIHRHDYLPGWDPEVGLEGARLEELWSDASQNVSHLSWKRVPDANGVVVLTNVAPANLALLAGLMLAIVESFTRELESTGHPNRVQFRAALDLGHQRMSGKRPGE
ncbi:MULTISPECIES: hypothetical protein [unclassified Nocardioides]|uniref:hypothetical protein n=1 Tax=unclassified Nocardioides TaxID=2615069 RepID=UPI0000570CEB|nr:MULTISPECIES: hypothetical protein [unclassified Nocardioides]ABL79463.1 hypothetical protein Noca_4881 [Nocardioides sp. JS614]